MRAKHSPSARRISAFAIVVCSACVAARADYASDRQAALALVAAKQHKQALAAFLKMSETAQNDYQLRNGIHEYALEELDKAGNVRGYWLVQSLRTRAAILAAMGRTAEAQDVYRAALKTDGIRDAQKSAIEAALERMLKQE